MKQIGEILKETREKNGVTVEEAASDLGLKNAQISSIESGDVKAFKDVYYLKNFIKDYAKYLGLDSEKVLEDFNEFIFDYTSRIPLDNIDNTKKIKTNEPKKIASPYTMDVHKVKLSPILFYIMIAVIILTIVFLIYGIYISQSAN